MASYLVLGLILGALNFSIAPLSSSKTEQFIVLSHLGTPITMPTSLSNFIIGIVSLNKADKECVLFLQQKDRFPFRFCVSK